MSGELEMCGMGRRAQDGERGNGDGNRRYLVLMLIGKERKVVELGRKQKERLVFD